MPRHGPDIVQRKVTGNKSILNGLTSVQESWGTQRHAERSTIVRYSGRSSTDIKTEDRQDGICLPVLGSSGVQVSHAGRPGERRHRRQKSSFFSSCSSLLVSSDGLLRGRQARQGRFDKSCFGRVRIFLTLLRDISDHFIWTSVIRPNSSSGHGERIDKCRDIRWHSFTIKVV